MPEVLDHVAYLSQEIGPRPAGTEEEQQAALYITEHLQKEAGLPAVIEDFNGAGDADLPRMICCGAAVLAALIALIFPVVGIVAVIVSLLAALLFAAEAFDKPVLSKVLGHGVSQNVVAKYEPGYSAEHANSRRRKVIIVARYDSGKVRAELGGPLAGILPAVQWASFGGLVALPVLLILRTVVFANAEGAFAAILTVFTVVAMILAAVPLVIGVLHQTASYNEAANNNAAGVAALLEVARRVGTGRVSEAELGRREDVAIHGEEAARAAGLVPDGAEIVYDEGPQAPDFAPQSGEVRLTAAKAAVAALTGKPVSGVSAADIARNLVQVKEPPVGEPDEDVVRKQRSETREAFSSVPAETVEEALAHAEAVAAEQLVAEGEAVAEEPAAAQPAAPAYPVPAPAPADEAVPEWFKKAQAKAHKTRVAEKPVQRSRYASALDAADAETRNRAAEAPASAAAEAAQPLEAEAVREEVLEVKAPQWSAVPAGEAPGAEDVAAEQRIPAEEAPASQAVSAAYEEVRDPAPVPAAGEAVSLGTAPDPAPAAQPAGDSLATTAFAPIDVRGLSLDDVPPVRDVPMPSFLDPQKVQEEARAQRSDAARTDNRIAVGDPSDIEDVLAEPAASGTVSPFVPEIEAAVPTTPQPQTSGVAPASRPIMLPSIGVAAAKPAPVAGAAKQRAPLADVESAGKAAAKSLLNMLPSISAADAAAEQAGATGTADSDAKEKRASLKAMLPSLSGAIARTDATAAKSSSVNAAGSFAAAGATGAFAPIGDELIENVDPDDIYVDDADDSAYDENFTETGAFAGPGYVEMPKSRFRRFLDKFHRNDDEPEPTPQEWLDVDDQFEARTVGAQRGGWESFREDGVRAGQAADADDAYRIDDVADADVDGQTVAFQPIQAENGSYDAVYGQYDEYDGHEGEYDRTYASDGAYAAQSDGFDEADVADEPAEEGKPRRRWFGGAYSTRRMESADLDSAAVAEEAAAAAAAPGIGIDDELGQVYQFRNPDINTEVWFVALGSELAQNSGMRAFIAEHQQELRGAFIIEIDALGAGDLSMIEREGVFKAAKTSSRMKRYVRKASQATGISVGGGTLLWQDSAASYASKHGLQAMHLVGMEGGKPANYGQADDVMENIDEATLRANVGFLMELLKNI